MNEFPEIIGGPAEKALEDGVELVALAPYAPVLRLAVRGWPAVIPLLLAVLVLLYRRNTRAFGYAELSDSWTWRRKSSGWARWYFRLPPANPSCTQRRAR